MKEQTFEKLWHYVKENPGQNTSRICRNLGLNENATRDAMAGSPKFFRFKVGARGARFWSAIGKAPKVAEAPKDPVARAQAERADARIRREHGELLKEVEELRRAMAVRDALAAAPLPQIQRREFASGLREGTAVALLSDLHVEERVLETDTPNGNVYNLDIADLRLSRTFAGIEWLVQKERQTTKIRDLQVWFGGDMASGHIHEENVETSAFPPIAAMLWLQPRLIGGIRQLADRLELERLDLVCSYGNHGRDTKKPRRATGAHHSYEWGMYQQIAREFHGDKRIRVLADPSAHQYTQIYDYTCHYHHGDEISYHGGVGGVFIPMNKAVARWNRVRRADFNAFGHFHYYFDLGDVAGNGSLIGYNGYAMSIGASPEEPLQSFYVIDSKRGKTAKSPIWSGDRSEEAQFRGVAA
jgi:hypothetical protein